MIEKLLEIVQSYEHIASEAIRANVLKILLDNEDLSEKQILNLLKEFINNYKLMIYKNSQHYKLK